MADILSLIDSASTAVYIDRDEDLWNIISEGASGYFSGASSAQEAARIIQSRVSILVSERS